MYKVMHRRAYDIPNNAHNSTLTCILYNFFYLLLLLMCVNIIINKKHEMYINNNTNNSPNSVPS